MSRHTGAVLWDTTPVSGFPAGTHRALPEGHTGGEPEYLDPVEVLALPIVRWVQDVEAGVEVIEHEANVEDARWHRNPDSPGYDVDEYVREATIEHVTRGHFEYLYDEEAGS